MSIAQMVLREKTRADSIRKGLAAQQIAKQPKVVEKDLMNAGIAAAPVDLNVPQGGIVGSNGQMSNTAAGGGIVAFADGGVPRSNQPTFIGSLSGGSTVDPAVLRAYYIANGLPVPEELKNIEGRAAGREKQSYDPALYGQPSDTVQSGNGEFWPALGKFGTALKDAFLYNSDVAAQREAEGKKVNLPTMDQLRAAAAKTRESMTPGGRYELDQGRASSGIGMQDVIDYARQQAGVKGAPATAPADKGISTLPAAKEVGLGSAGSAKSYADQVKQFYKEAGYDFEGIKKAEQERIAKQESELSADRTQDAWMAMLRAGLGMMGGESPYALTNIGKGAELGIESYAKSTKESRAAKKELEKAKVDLAKAEQLDRKGLAEQALGLREKSADRQERALDRISREKIANMPGGEQKLISALGNGDLEAGMKKYLTLKAEYGTDVITKYAAWKKGLTASQQLLPEDQLIKEFMRANVALGTIGKTERVSGGANSGPVLTR